MAGSLGQFTAPVGETDEATADLIGGLTQFLAPVLLGVQAGSMVGHLAQSALGNYGLPIPRPSSDELMIVPANIDGITDEGGLARDDVRLWVLIDELTRHAVLSRPHVRRRLADLVNDFVALFQPDLGGLEQRLGGIDPTNPASFEEVLGRDPAELISSMRSPAQHLLLSQISTLVAAIEGYVGVMVDRAAEPLIPTRARVAAAVRERRESRDDADPIAEALFGMEMKPALYERGRRFAQGVVDRSGVEGLARLWDSDLELPTPAELDAPGLWWERINLPTEDIDFGEL
jgi:putative hydrolase